MLPDKLLVKQILNGNINAFNKLYERYFRKIYKTVSNRVSLKEDTEDIVQTVFVEIFENLNKYDFKYAFSTWAYTITKNRVSDYLRSKYNIHFTRLDLFVMNNAFDEENDSSDHVAREKSINLISLLKGNKKEVLTKRYIHNMKFKDIAQNMNITLNNAKVIHNRAINDIKNLLTNKS